MNNFWLDFTIVVVCLGIGVVLGENFKEKELRQEIEGYRQNSASTETMEEKLEEDLLAMGYTPHQYIYPNGSKEITWSK